MRRLLLVTSVLAVSGGASLWLPATSGALEPRGEEIGSADIDQLHGGDKVRALIDQVVTRQRSLRSLRAEFRQRKESSMLLEPVESSGEFSFRAPDRVRWDFASPEPMVVLFAEDTVTTFHPTRRRAERVKISRRQRRFVRVLAGTQPLDDLATQFSITLADDGGAAPYRLTLLPTSRTLGKRLQSVVLQVDRRLLLPVVIECNETDGDSTSYEFVGMEINPELADSLFHLDLGSDVLVERIDLSIGAV